MDEWDDQIIPALMAYCERTGVSTKRRIELFDFLKRWMRDGVVGDEVDDEMDWEDELAAPDER